jgi:C4-dicarboxylate-specific signal transduction histidine kinase
MAAELSKKLVQSSKLSALGEMSAGVAHEINNPLSIIRANSKLILKKIKRNEYTEEDAIKKLTSILTTTDRIAAIIRGLRGFSRNGDEDPFKVENLNSIVNETFDFCRERFKSEAIELTFNNDINATIKCRKVQLEQVLLNILNNAYDAISESTNEKWIRLTLLEDDGYYYLNIMNSGEKISETVMNKIMEPFFTTKGVGKGTGLGLSIARNIMIEHKDDLYVDKEKNNTCFVIKLSKNISLI